MTKITLSIGSRYLHNKDNSAPSKISKITGKLGNDYILASFQNREWTPEEIKAHILEGRAVCIAAVNNDHRHGDDWQSAQMIGLDFDKGPAVKPLSEDDFVHQYAFMVYASPSSTTESPRTRALFILDGKLTDKELFRKYIKRLLKRFSNANADTQCKDIVRFYYGHENAEHIFNADAVLPISVLEALPIHPDEIPRAEKPMSPIQTNGDFSPYVAKVIENVVTSVRSAPNGERNDTLNKAALTMGHLVAADWSHVSRLQGESILLTAAPISSDFPEHEVRATINSGITAGLAEPMPAPAVNGSHANGSKPAVDPVAQAVQTAAQPASDVDRLALAIDKLTSIRKRDERRPDDVEEAIGRLDKELEILRAKTAKPVRVSSSVVGKRVFSSIRENQKHPQPIQGLRSNIPLLDTQVGGFRDGRVHVLLGDTNMGKSTFAAQLAAQWFQQKTILIVCTECPIDAFYTKMLASVTGIPSDRISDGLVNASELADLEKWQKKFDALVFDFLEGSSPTVSQMWQAVFDMNDGHDTSFGGMIVDSISNVKAPGARGEYEEQTTVSDTIQDIALTANIPVFATSQVGRSLKDRANKMPRKNDGRGSGAIEENCDVLLSIYVHDHYVKRNEAQPDPGIPTGMGLMPVLKHRWKESGGQAVPLRFVGGVKFDVWNGKTVNVDEMIEAEREIDL